MGRKILLAVLIVVSVSSPALTASASTAKPTIESFKPTIATVGTEVTIDGAHLAGATKVTVNGSIATVVSDTSTNITADVPADATTGTIKVKTAGGTVSTRSDFTVLTPLDGATSAENDSEGYCLVLASSGVDCWGKGGQGQLGNGVITRPGSATPVAVAAVGGTGILAGVTNLVGHDGSYCALMNGSGVDCWGLGGDGQLGNGTFYTGSLRGSLTPVVVSGVGGTGTLTGVTSLIADGPSYCALVTSGGVVCWGWNYFGELGNGTFNDSATPVSVEGVGGFGTLTGVAALTGGGFDNCALLSSGGVDCWGWNAVGELGNASYGDSASPVAVVGVGGIGELTGATNLIGDGDGSGYCALVTSGGVDCWGDDSAGELGDGTYLTTSPQGSATPVAVEGVNGAGTLTSVTDLFGGGLSYCAVSNPAGMVCWGYGGNGELGNGTFDDSAVPTVVEGIGGIGVLTGVTDVTSDMGDSYCALMNSGGADCWGYGNKGQLGDGAFYTTGNEGSATPVAVQGVGGTGTITAVKNLVGDAEKSGYCAVLTSSAIDCWGYGAQGELGNGSFSPGDSDSPVAVG